MIWFAINVLYSKDLFNFELQRLELLETLKHVAISSLFMYGLCTLQALSVCCRQPQQAGLGHPAPVHQLSRQEQRKAGKGGLFSVAPIKKRNKEKKGV